MNKKLFILAKTLMKNSFALPTDQKKKMRQALLLAFLVLCFVPLVVGLIKFVAGMYDGLTVVGEQGALLSLGIAVSAIVIFFFGLLYTMNTFYFSEDIENLLPLPVKSSHILGVKFIVVTIFEYLTEVVILLPLLIVYGLKSDQSFLYYLYGLLIFLTLPVLPIVLDSVVVMIIMRFTNLAKNKDAFRIISAMVAIFFGVGINIFAQRMTLNQGIGQLGNNSLVAMTSAIFPPAKLGALGLINSGTLGGLAYICQFLALSLVGFYLFLFLGNLLYYKGVNGVSVSSSRRKSITEQELIRQTVRSSVLKSYVLKELRILFRTPSYFINCIIINFIWPIFLILSMLTKPKITSGVIQLKGMLQNPNLGGITVGVGFGIILIVASINGIASTSISREGESILFNKYIPVSYKTQIWAKVITGVLMGIVAMLTMGVAMIFVLGISWSFMAVICGASLLGILFSNLVGVFIDLLNPKLHWSDEQRAVKQNLNLLFSLVICALFSGLGVWALIKLQLTISQTALSLVAIYALLDVLLYRILMKKGSELFSKIEY